MCVRAIIIGQNYSTSIGLINAIGIDGYSSAAIKRVTHKPLFPTPELVCKYVKKYEYVEVRPEEQMIRLLIDHYANTGYRIVLIPSDDYCSALLDRYRDQLEEFFIVPGVKNGSNVGRLMDKEGQKAIAEQFGIPTAGYRVININDWIEKDLDEIIYPCITKPKKSIEGSKKHICICNDKSELKNVLENVINDGSEDILVENVIDYDCEYTVPGLALPGVVYIPALLKKTRIGRGEHQGVTGTGEVIPISSCISVIDRIKNMIRSLGFIGIFDVELFKKGEIYYFNELNLRNGAAGYALTAAGANIPGAFMEWALTGNTDYSFKPRELNFVSEKVILESYESGMITWKDYRRIVKSADVRLVNDLKDKKCRDAFLLLEIKAILRVTRNKMRKKLKWDQ